MAPTVEVEDCYDIEVVYELLTDKAKRLLSDLEAFRRYLDNYEGKEVRPELGLSKFETDVQREAKLLQKWGGSFQAKMAEPIKPDPRDSLDGKYPVSTATKYANELHQIRSSNIGYLDSIWQDVMSSKGVVGIRKHVKYTQGKPKTEADFRVNDKQNSHARKRAQHLAEIERRKQEQKERQAKLKQEREKLEQERQQQIEQQQKQIDELQRQQQQIQQQQREQQMQLERQQQQREQQTQLERQQQQPFYMQPQQFSQHSQRMTQQWTNNSWVPQGQYGRGRRGYQHMVPLQQQYINQQTYVNQYTVNVHHHYPSQVQPPQAPLQTQHGWQQPQHPNPSLAHQRPATTPEQTASVPKAGHINAKPENSLHLIEPEKWQKPLAPVKLPGRLNEADIFPGRNDNDMVVVDVICDNGAQWIKMFTRSQRWLELELAKEGLIDLGYDSDEPADRTGPKFFNEKDTYLLEDLKLVKMARQYQKAARMARFNHRHPKIHFHLPRISRGMDEDVDLVIGYMESIGVTILDSKQCKKIWEANKPSEEGTAQEAATYEPHAESVVTRPDTTPMTQAELNVEAENALAVQHAAQNYPGMRTAPEPPRASLRRPRSEPLLIVERPIVAPGYFDDFEVKDVKNLNEEEPQDDTDSIAADTATPSESSLTQEPSRSEILSNGGTSQTSVVATPDLSERKPSLTGPVDIEPRLLTIFDRMTSPAEHPPTTATLNLDCTVLIALISEISHRGRNTIRLPAHYNNRSAGKDIEMQMASEEADALLPNHIYPVLRGKRLVCTEQVAKHLAGIVQLMGSPDETLRSHLIIQQPTAAKRSSESVRRMFGELSSHAVPDDLELPVQLICSSSTLNNYTLDGKIMTMLAGHPRLSPLNQSVFFHGWLTDTTTVSLNRVVSEWLVRAVDGCLDEIEWKEKIKKDIVDSRAFRGPRIRMCGRERSLIGNEKFLSGKR